jgi:hypothetical protein
MISGTMTDSFNTSVVKRIFTFLFLTFLVSCGNDELDSNSLEGIEARNLRSQRYEWLEDGCPQPPVAAKYLEVGRGDVNYTYAGTLVVSNYVDVFGVVTKRTFHGLFATKDQGWSRTLVITMTGDIIAIEDSGQVRLLEMCSMNGNPYKPRIPR